MRYKVLFALPMFVLSIGVILYGLILKEHDKTILGIAGLVIAGFLIYSNDKEIETAQRNRETVEFESIERKMHADNFIYEKAVDVGIKLLGEDSLPPFSLKASVVGDNLILVGNKYNKNFLYTYYNLTDIPYYKIPVDKIHYYTRDGEIITTTVGRGGGSSYSIVTGWNGKVNPVNIDTHITDNKHTALYYDKDEKDMVLTFQYDDYHKFKRLIPSKDYEIVQSNIIAKPIINEGSVNQVTSNDDISSKLKQLTSLLNEKLITEEEFKTKRNQLLDKI